jgi:hypothetical protein
MSTQYLLIFGGIVKYGKYRKFRRRGEKKKTPTIFHQMAILPKRCN